MIKMLTNQKELKQIYTFDQYASSSYEHVYKLAYKRGLSTWNNDLFNPYLSKLVNNGILTKLYDFTKDGNREAIYTFSDGSEIEFFGTDHMNMKLTYNYWYAAFTGCFLFISNHSHFPTNVHN